MRNPDAKQALEFLTSIDYPATKEAIVDHADGEGADPDVLRVLRSLPLATYENDDEVVRSLPSPQGNPAIDPSSAARAVHGHDRPGLAQDQRSVDR